MKNAILEPYPFQERAINKLMTMEYAALLADCGLGKTCMFINLFVRRDLNRMLVLCPRSVMESAWLDDVPKFSNKTVDIIYHKDMKKRIKMLEESTADILVINYDVIGKLLPYLPEIDMVVLDESTFIKNHASKRAKACMKLSKNIPYRYIATATPGHDPERFWSQWTFLSTSVFNMSFFSFKEKYYYKIPLGDTGMNLFKFNINYTEEINKKITRCSIRIRKEEAAPDMPDRVFHERLIDLPPSARKAYIEMSEGFVWEDIVAFFSPTKRMKLRQITNGFIQQVERGRDSIHKVVHTAKVSECSHIVDMIPEDEHIIIWASFRSEMTVLAKKFKCPIIAGGQKDNMKTIRDFKAGKMRIIVAHPQSCAHGVTFISANHSIFFSLPDDHELFCQAMDRTHRIGQTMICNYYIIMARNTVDTCIWKELHKKIKSEKLLTRMDVKIPLHLLM